MSIYWSYFSNVASISMFKATISVVFPYIIVIHLNSSATELGVFQTVLLALGIFFGPIGGFFADRIDPAKLLAGLQWFAIGPLAILLFALSQDAVTYELILILGVLGFAALGMTQPPLDVLVHTLGDEGVQNKITGSLFLAYLTSAIGYLLAAGTDLVGISSITLVMMACLGIGAILSHQLVGRYSKPVAQSEAKSRYGFFDGYRYTFQSPLIRPTVILMGLAGLLLGGPIGVLVPLLLRDEYGGSALQFALVYGSFMLGGALSNALLGLMKGVVMTGVALGAGFALCVLALLIWAADTEFYVFILGSAVWGVGGGLCSCMSRTIVQMNVPQEIRARALSAMYSLDEGAAPIGSLLAGIIAAVWGVRELALICGVATFLVMVVIFSMSTELRQERDMSADI